MNKFKVHITFLLLFLFIGISALQAQLPDDDEERKELEYTIFNGPPPARGYRFQIGASIQAPHILLNPAQARAFDAIVGVGLNIHTKVWNNLYLGIHGEYDGFVFYKPFFNQTTLTSSHFYALGSVMYMKIWESGIGFIPSLRFGNGWVHYSGVSDGQDGSKTLDYSGWVFQGLGGLYYFPFENEYSGVGLQLGATWFSHEFKKDVMHLSGDESLYPRSDDGGTMHISIGFSVVFNIGRMN